MENGNIHPIENHYGIGCKNDAAIPWYGILDCLVDKLSCLRQAHTIKIIFAIAFLLFLVNPGASLGMTEFTNVSTESGVGGDSYRAENNHSLGVNWIDYDNDDWPDIFAVNGYDRLPHLFHNNGNGTFTKVDHLLPALPNYEKSGSIFADFDNDGDSDIYIYTDTGTGVLTIEPDGPPNLLLKNLWVENGNQLSTPLFTEIAAQAGIDDLPDAPFGAYPGYKALTASWLDYDRDGCIDLYIGHWAIELGGNVANKDRLYKNNCNGTFTDVTAVSGVNPGVDPQTYRPGLVVIGAHLNGDLWPDLYVGNTTDPRPLNYDFLFLNNGDGTFSDIANPEVTPGGIGNDSQSAMGIDVADIDLDGDWDIYITDILKTVNDDPPLGNPLYINNGNGTFQDNTADIAGVTSEFSWGVNFIDADQDGYEDIFLTTKAILPNLLYQNNGDSTFTEITEPAGLSEFLSGGRGSATADYDGDGDLDIALVSQDGKLDLFRNDTTDGGNWLQLKLVTDPARAGTKSNRDGIGTIVKVKTGSLNMMRQVKGGSSAHSQNSLVVHFGLGNALTIGEIRILWPSGEVDVLCNFSSNQKYEIEEGSAPDDSCIIDNSPPTWPGGPVLSVVDAKPSGVVLSWFSAQDNVGIIGYNIFRDGILFGTTTGLTYTDNILGASAKYCYKVEALDASGNSSVESNEVCADIAESDLIAPDPPPSMKATIAEGLGIDLTWGVPNDNVGVNEYKIYRDGVSVGSSSVPLYLDTGLAIGTTYCYTVTAFDFSGNESLPSNQSCTTPDDFSKPSTPTNLAATGVSATSVQLSWGAATDDVGIEGYRVYRGLDLASEPIDTTWTDVDVIPGTAYTYVVTAIDVGGNESFPSEAVQITTALTVSGSDPEPEDPAGEDAANGDDPEDDAGDEGSGGGGCFIATAAFGSPLEPQVELLKAVRDRVLKTFVLGEEFIELYYKYSPPAAAVIEDSQIIRILVRWMLWPVVAGSWLMLEADFSLKIMMITVLIIIGRHQRKKEKTIFQQPLRYR